MDVVTSANLTREHPPVLLSLTFCRPFWILPIKLAQWLQPVTRPKNVWGEKGVWTQFIILSENFIRSIIISYKYIMHLNLHIHVYLSLIVWTGINKHVWPFVSCSLIIELYSRALYITVSMMTMLSKSRTLVIYPQLLCSFCMINIYTYHRKQYFFRVLEDG